MLSEVMELMVAGDSYQMQRMRNPVSARSPGITGMRGIDYAAQTCRYVAMGAVDG